MKNLEEVLDKIEDAILSSEAIELKSVSKSEREDSIAQITDSILKDYKIDEQYHNVFKQYSDEVSKAIDKSKRTRIGEHLKYLGVYVENAALGTGFGGCLFGIASAGSMLGIIGGATAGLVGGIVLDATTGRYSKLRSEIKEVKLKKYLNRIADYKKEHGEEYRNEAIGEIAKIDSQYKEK